MRASDPGSSAVAAELTGRRANGASKDSTATTILHEKRRNWTEMNNHKTIRDLEKEYPSIPWLDYINTILAPSFGVTRDQSIWVLVPSYMRELEELLKKTPKRTLANYALWRIVQSSISYLSNQIRERQLQYNSLLTGRTKRQPRWKECTKTVTDTLPISVGSLYVRRHFDKKAKESAEKMVQDIHREFVKVLNEVDWMDPKTREAAIFKAESITSHVAYPDELLNDTLINDYYADLDLTRGSFLWNSLKVGFFLRSKIYHKLKEPVEKYHWSTYSETADVNAFYSPNENALQIPAGILQGALFNSERPNYMNYGAIGSMVGHEITHGFDDEGSQFDAKGNTKNWWEDASKDEFIKKVQCIIDQANNYTVLGTSRNVNGKNTQGENVADNGGIKVAYRAYNAKEIREGKEPRLYRLEKYTPRQLFWISYAQTWCGKMKPEALNHIITTNEHSPADFRVNGPVSNMIEFAQDFKCSSNSTMVRQNRCTVW
ncbi:hypothetical protein QAD02_009875 [Eretmocerus hayati]|uniref:Uncharacterized protein n=1 Tax=Eretmocerus hayati TaxID=131215 RepID=A0ACC2NAW6_9HYME|nr:hypothetical protein QAD02_009875 [Eretmocerus hayati]